MYTKYLEICDEMVGNLVFADNVQEEQSSLWGVYVNNGLGNWVLFGNPNSAVLFQKYCLACGISTLRQAI